MQERFQFQRLARNFLARFFESDFLSPQADFRATLSQALGLLASPGLFIPLLLMPMLMMDSNAARSWPIKLIFVFLSLEVMGVLSVLEWDALMLDRRDQAILLSLPLRPRTVFAAKFWALAQFMLIFSVDVSAGSILLLPPLEMVGLKGGGFLTMARYAAAHAAGAIGAGAFAFLFVVSLQATLINTCKPVWFRRISTAIQAVAILTLLMAFFMFPAALSRIPEWKAAGSALFRWFPAAWFVAWCEVLQGTADAQFHALARTGVYALGAAGLWATAAYAVAYGRHTRAALEMPAKATRGRERLWRVLRGAGNPVLGWLIKDPVERATFRFTARTMLQSPKHRLILAAYAGTGLAIVLEEIIALSFRGGDAWRQARETALLSLPLVVSFFLLSGMRFVFNVPSELPANWIFQITQRGDSNLHLGGVRKCMALAVVAPLTLVTLTVYSLVFGAPAAIFHTAYCAVLSLLMIEGLLWRMEKLPFACSYAPGRVPVVALLCGYGLAFMAYTDLMVWIETHLLASGAGMAVSLIVLGGALWTATAYRKGPLRAHTPLIFHEEPEPVVRTLDLSV